MINIPKREGSKWIAGGMVVLTALQSLLPGILSIIMFFSITGGYVLNNPQPAEAVNRSSNGNFESGNVNWTEVEVTNPTYGTTNIDGTTPISGSYSLRIEDAPALTKSQYVAYRYQTVSITAGSKVKLSLKWKKLCTTNITQDSEDIFVEIKKPSSTVVTAWSELTDVSAAGTAISGSISGTDISSNFNETGVYEIRLKADLTNGNNTASVATAWFDNIQLQVSPENLATGAPVDTTNVTMSWNTSTPGSGAPALSYYNVYRDGSFLASSAANVYTDSTSQGNTTYRYWISDVDTAAVESPTSSYVDQLTRPGPPTGVTAVDRATNKEVTVSWTAPAGGVGAQGYRVYYQTQGYGTWDLATSGITLNTVAVSVPANKTTYSFSVSGENTSGEGPKSSPSNDIQATDGINPSISWIDPLSSKTFTGSSKLITGDASDNDVVDKVDVQIERSIGPPYWDSVASTWSASSVWNTASYTKAATTSWSYTWSFSPAVQDSTPSYTIRARTLDENPNTGNATPITGNYIDNQAPNVTNFKIENNAPYTNTTAVTLEPISASDGSGSIFMRFADTTGGLSSASTQPYNTTAAYSLSAGDGTKWVYSQFWDDPPNEEPTGAFNITTPGVTNSYDSIFLDTQLPTASNFYPANQATSVSVNTLVTVAIDDPAPASDIVGSSVSTTSFTLTPTSGISIPASVDFSSGTVATLTPSQTLAYGSIYTASLSNGIQDNAGNRLVTASWSFTTEQEAGPPPDGQGPDVSFTAPTGTSWLVGSTYLITGIASDSASTISSAKVRIYDSTVNKYWNNSIWVDPPADTESYSESIWVTAAASDGNFNSLTESFNYSWPLPQGVENANRYQIKAKSEDASSNIGSSPLLTDVEVDTKVPQIGSFNFTINNGATYATSQTVTLSGYDPVTDNNSVYMRFAETTAGLSTTQSYNSTASFAFASDGSKTVYSQFIDAPTPVDTTEGKYYNQTTAGYSGTYDSIFVDTQLPTASNFYPANGATTVAVDTNVTAAIDDPGGGAASGIYSNTITTSSFTLVTSGGSVSADVTFSAGVATLNPTNTLAYGTTYTVSMSSGIKDNAGNTLNPVSWSFTTEAGTDTQDPNVSITDPASSKTLTTTSKLIAGSADDNIGVQNVEVRIKRNSPTLAYWTGSDWGSETWINAHMSSTGSTSTNWDYTWNFGSGYDNYGNITIDAIAMDAVPNTSSYSQVTGINLDNKAPTISSFSISGGATYANSTSVTLNNNVTDSSSYSMRFANSSGELSTASYSSYNSTAAYTLPSGDGAKTVYSQFKDNPSNAYPTGAYNETTAGISGSFDSVTLDTTKPTVSSYGPTGSDVPITTNVTAAFSDATSWMDTASISEDTFFIKPPSGVTEPASVTFSGGIATLNPTTSALNYGTTYTVSMSSGIKDNAGNTLDPVSWTFTTESPAGPGSLSVENDSNSGNVNKGTNKNVSQRLLMTASGGDVTLQSMTVGFSGSAVNTDVPNIYLFKDTNGDGLFTNGESAITVSYSGAGDYKFDNISDTINSGQTAIYAVAFDVASGAATGATLSSNVAADEDINVSQGNVSTNFNDYGSGVFTVVAGTPQVDGLNVIARAFPTMALSWNSVSGGPTYDVVRSQSSGGTFSSVTSGLSVTYYDDATIPTAAIYYYKVRATVGGQPGAYSTAAASITGNSNISISYNVSGTTSIESADGQLKLVVPNDTDNYGTWNIEERSPSSYNFNSNITPQSPYIWFDAPTSSPQGNFTLKLRTTKGPAGNTKVLWKYDGSNWSKNVGSNYSWSDYLFFNADVSGFSGYLVAGGVGNTTGQGPHGGYSSGSNKCKDCHAVHEAGEASFKSGATYKLLRASTQEDVCEFCHGSQGVASNWNIILQQSGHGPAKTSGPEITAPDAKTPAFSINPSADYAWSCIRCHNPHNGGTIQSLQYDKDSPTTSNKLLRANPSGDGTPLTSSVVYLSQWCAQCHGANIGTFGESKQVPDGFGGTTTAYGHDVSTGGMSTTSYSGVIYANVRQNVQNNTDNKGPTCRQCHAAGKGDQGYVTGQDGKVGGGTSAYAEGRFPHAGYSDSYGLLKSGIGTEQNATLDDVCNDCHYTPSLP